MPEEGSEAGDYKKGVVISMSETHGASGNVSSGAAWSAGAEIESRAATLRCNVSIYP